MSKIEIHPRSDAAEGLRSALEYAEWLQTESQARGEELSWDAAVIAASNAGTVLMHLSAINDNILEAIQHLEHITGFRVEYDNHKPDES